MINIFTKIPILTDDEVDKLFKDLWPDNEEDTIPVYRPAYQPPVCTCGAAKTQNPNCHGFTCDRYELDRWKK